MMMMQATLYDDDNNESDMGDNDAGVFIQRPPSAIPPPVTSITFERPAWATAAVTDSYDQTVIR
jgi:hypothetical protein